MGDVKLNLAGLAPAAVAAAVLFTLTWAVLGRVSRGFTLFGTHITPYNWVAQPVSGLGLGDTARTMNSVFVITGALLALGIVGTLASLSVLSTAELWALWATLLLSPLGFAICGIFNLERILIHSIGYFSSMASAIIGFAALGWRLGRHEAYEGVGSSLIVAAAVSLVLLIVYVRSFDPQASGRGLGVGGLTQRLLVTQVLGTFACLAWWVSVRTW
jgi:hypothetical protein